MDGARSWPGGQRPWGGRLPGPWLPLVVGVAQALGTWLASRDESNRRAYDVGAFALLVGTGLALALRHRAPIGTLAVVAAGTAAYYGSGYPHGPAFVAVVIATVVAVRGGRQVAAWATLIGGYLAFFAIAAAFDTQHFTMASVATNLVWLAAIVGVAELVRVRAEHFAEVRERMREAQRRQASDERLLLARELHDVLAHNVSLISVQASTALHLFDEDPERARSALATIKSASHETLQELRATVGALRADGELVPRSPFVGLERLDELVAQTRGTGLDVGLDRLGTVRTLPARVELAAYRIVQEALTNVRRHSGASSAEVELDYRADALGVRVTDNGHGLPTDRPENAALEQLPGHGLRGMRERALALGGTLHLGQDPAGGFVISARIPLADDQAAPNAGRPA